MSRSWDHQINPRLDGGKYHDLVINEKGAPGAILVSGDSDFRLMEQLSVVCPLDPGINLLRLVNSC